MFLSWLSVAGCRSDFDWCIEDRIPGIPAEGSIDIAVRSAIFGDRDVVIEKVIVESLAADVVEVRGCARAGGDLYRFDGRFGGFVSGQIDVPFEISGAAGPWPSFTGELMQCIDGDCTRVGGVFNTTANGSGVMHAYDHVLDPSAGTIDTELTVSSSAGNVQTTVSVDVVWPAP